MRIQDIVLLGRILLSINLKYYKFLYSVLVKILVEEIKIMTDQEFLKLLIDKKVADAYQYFYLDINWH